MKERGILFTGTMVRPLAKDLKDQTRRLSGLKSVNLIPNVYEGPFEAAMAPGSGPSMNQWALRDKVSGQIRKLRCPYGVVGDHLCVKETFYIDDGRWSEGGRLPATKPGDFDDNNIYYRADGDCCEQIPECACGEVGKPRWRPSLLMNRWCSRITLSLTNIRLQRLQDITEAESRAEGIRWTEGGPLHAHIGLSHVNGAECNFTTALDAYRALWGDINGIYSWDLNPWVWALTFKRVAP